MTSIYIQTFGCSLNYSDSELMAGLLSEAGHTITHDLEQADILVINSCSVKNEAEAKLWRWIKNNPDKKLVVTGCVPQAQPSLLKEEDRLRNISVIGTNNLNDILEAVQSTIQGNVYHSLAAKKQQRLNLPKIRKNPVVEILPINKGCLDNCTYCKTKQARGHLQSYPVKDIQKQAEAAIADGCQEIWLTSQDTGCYGLDIGTNIINLLNKLLSLRGFFRIRLGMMNPNYALEFLDELKEIMQHPKMFKFLHIPVQSGSNKVLRDMQRRYKAEAFVKVVTELKKSIPKISISTDIIVAFPTETIEDFNQTLDLIKNTIPETMNLSRYWTRPNTPAAAMEQIKGGESKKRSIELGKVYFELRKELQEAWKDWQGEVIIDEKGPDGSMIGRNDYYKQIVFPMSNLELGTRTEVKIEKINPYDLQP